MGTDVPIFALPPDPVYGGRVPVGFCNISGAQNLSGFPRFLPGHWALVWRKISAGAVSHQRLTFPSRRRLVLSRRARPPGRAAYICGPASVWLLRKEGSGFCVRRRGGSVTRPSGFRQVGGRGDPCGRLLFPCRTT